MEIPERILDVLNKAVVPSLNSLSLASEFNEDHQKIVGGIKSLECLGNVIESKSDVVKRWQLTDEGQGVVANGSHEAVVFSKVPADGILQPDLMKACGSSGKVGFSKAMSAGWLLIDKSGGKPLVKRKVDSINDAVREHLKLVAAGKIDQLENKVRDDYKKRKLLHEVNITAFEISKGAGFTTKIEKAATELTPEMLASGAWKTASFKPYNFSALGKPPPAGHLHPLLKVRAEYRQIFLEMGFSEMPTNNFVESSFWNFDALFQPQQHPARDAHDTFFISDPANATDFPQEYLEKVKTVHSKGGFGSQGYGYDWKIEEARKNILRTHTTAVSARMLYKLAENKEFKPQKYFSIDRVFRNETLDATHLAEFHQIEGLVADYDLTLGDLIGVIYEFFKKLGIEKLRFKPAYNPYTEPSMEIFSYHEGLQKWVEIGNSGIFRPEMLLPMGLPEDVSVIAWGLSLERPTMIKYGIDNIRDLVGHKVNLKMVQENPICRLDKDTRDPVYNLATVTERRYDRIEKQLNYLAKEVEKLTGVKIASKCGRSSSSLKFRDIVIEMDPGHASGAVRYLVNKIVEVNDVHFANHLHSSTMSKLPHNLLDFWPSPNPCKSRLENQLGLTLIWKPVGIDPVLKTGPSTDSPNIVGEVNILRYLSRLSLANLYEECPCQTWVDQQLDYFHELLHIPEKDSRARMILAKQMSKASKRPSSLKGVPTLADVMFSSMAKKSKDIEPVLKSLYLPVH